MLKMNKAAAAKTLSLDKEKTMLENIGLMLEQAKAAGYTAVQPAHIYKPLKALPDYDWKAFNDHFMTLTEKAEGRGWYILTGKTVTKEEVEDILEGAPRGVAYIPRKTEADIALYGEDLGLKKIAIMGTRCFGEFAMGNKHCGACPLAGSCQVAAFAKIAEIAEILDAETEEAIKLPDEPVNENVEQEEGATEEVRFEEVEAPETPTLPEGAVLTTTPFTTLCSECGHQIEKGTECVNIRGRGNFHIGCV